jgi:hypothetical protein
LGLFELSDSCLKAFDFVFERRDFIWFNITVLIVFGGNGNSKVFLVIVCLFLLLFCALSFIQCFSEPFQLMLQC